MDADVVVVGAGPGGSAAAHWLARAGAKVMLLDRARFPRDKSCGDGITGHSVAIMHDMGVTFDSFGGKGARTFGGLIGGPSGGSFAADPPLDDDGGKVECWCVPRTVLDHALVRAAVRAGATLREETSFTGLVRRDGTVCGVEYSDRAGTGRIACKLVIGADGAHSPVARALGLSENPPPHLGYALRGYYDGVEGLSDKLEIYYYDRHTLPGYGWIFPVGDGLANIGIGIYSGELRRSRKKLRDLLDDFITQPQVAARCRNARPVGRALGWPLPVSSANRPTVFDGALLVGDAAALVDPLSGEGIWTAMVSGRSAARAALQGLSTGDVSRAALRSHELEWRAEAGGYLSSGRLLKNMAKSGLLLDLIVRRAAENEYYASRAIGYGLGTLDRRRALRSIVMKAVFNPSFFLPQSRDKAGYAAGR